MVLPDPVKVSPLIKFFRYSFLIAGIFYGATKKKGLEAIEAARGEQKKKLRLEREKKLAEEKELASQRDIAQIIEIFTGKKPDTLAPTNSDVPQETSYNEEVTEPISISEVKQSPEIQNLYFPSKFMNDTEVYKEYDDFSRVIDLREHYKNNQSKDKDATHKFWDETKDEREN